MEWTSRIYEGYTTYGPFDRKIAHFPQTVLPRKALIERCASRAHGQATSSRCNQISSFQVVQSHCNGSKKEWNYSVLCSLSISQRRPNARILVAATCTRFYWKFGESEGLYCPGYFTGILTGSSIWERFRQDYIHLTFWYLPIHSYTIWPTRRACHVFMRVEYYFCPKSNRKSVLLILKRLSSSLKTSLRMTRTWMKCWQYSTRH